MPRRIGRRLAIGWSMGTIVSALGVYLSLQLDLPTGATIVCTFGLVLIVMAAVRPLFVVTDEHEPRAIDAVSTVWNRDRRQGAHLLTGAAPRRPSRCLRPAVRRARRSRAGALILAITWWRSRCSSAGCVYVGRASPERASRGHVDRRRRRRRDRGAARVRQAPGNGAIIGADGDRSAASGDGVWIVWAVIVWNVVFDRVLVEAGREYVRRAWTAAAGSGPYARIDDQMRPAVSRAFWAASASAGVIVAIGCAAIRLAARRSPAAG